MPSVSVSNLELFRWWRSSADLGLEWLLRRLRGEEPQTVAQAAGEALHRALESCSPGETSDLRSGAFRFYVRCDCEVELPVARELWIEKQYGDLLVRGRVDGLAGRTVTDYKTTTAFDADRLMEGYQWRFYLDMLEADTFLWQVFVMDAFGDFAEADEGLVHCYEIYQVHELTQHRYEGLAEDCQELAADFWGFVCDLDRDGVEWRRAVLGGGAPSRH